MKMIVNFLLIPVLLFVVAFSSCGGTTPDTKDSSDSQVEFSIGGGRTANGPLPDYKISQDGTMVPITMSVTVDQTGPSAPVLRVWGDYAIKYSDHNRNDIYQRSIELRPVLGNQPVNINIPETRGGMFTVVFHASIRQQNGQVTTSHSETFSSKVIAESPKKQDVRVYIADDLFSVSIYFQSKFEQFDSSGQPSFNNGFGLYRIADPNAEQIWNWKKNVDFAKGDFQQRKDTAKQIPAKLRAQNPRQYANLPDFNDNQLLLETIQSYGTGQYHKAEQSTFSRKWKWVADSNNDGFAKKCVATNKEVQNGNFPTGWN